MMRSKTAVSKMLIHVVLIIGSLITLYPFAWMIFSSFKSTGTVMSLPPVFFPKKWTFENYQIIIDNNIGTYFFNSTYIALLRTIIPVYTSAILGYIFNKFEFRFKNIVFYTMISTMMLPWIVTIIPLYNLINKMGLIDSHLALILPCLCSSFGIFLVRSFMYQVPSSLMESARIDGCGEFRILNQIVLPLVLPAMSALGIILFLSAWDDYLFPFLVLNTETRFTLTVGLAKYAFRHYVIDYGPVVAGSVVSIIPVIVVYMIFQKSIVQGISLTGMKG